MKNVLVYPFDRDFLAVYRNMLKEKYSYKYFISPSGWGYDGLDIGTIDEGSAMGLRVSSNFEEALEYCDTLLVAQHSKWLERKTVLDRLLYAVENSKNIICLFELTKEEHGLLEGKCKDKNIEFKYFSNSLDEFDDLSGKVEGVGLRKINAPVVNILGMLENSNKFSTQLAFYNYLRERGYKAALIGSRSYGSFIDIHSIPAFMYSSNMLEHEKIIFFNNYVSQIELNFAPDVILIGIPGAIMPLTRKVHGHFGMLAYYISRAVESDATILCTYVENYNEEYLYNLKKICQYRFSADITGVLVDNISVEFHGQGLPENVSFMYLPEVIVENSISNIVSDVPFFHSKDKEYLFEHVVRELSNYSDYKTL